MWIALFSIVAAAAICLSVAAVLVQADRKDTRAHSGLLR
jgi:hypothetical protein